MKRKCESEKPFKLKVYQSRLLLNGHDVDLRKNNEILAELLLSSSKVNFSYKVFILAKISQEFAVRT